MFCLGFLGFSLGYPKLCELVLVIQSNGFGQGLLGGARSWFCFPADLFLLGDDSKMFSC